MREIHLGNRRKGGERLHNSGNAINGSKIRSHRRCAGEPVFRKYIPTAHSALLAPQTGNRRRCYLLARPPQSRLTYRRPEVDAASHDRKARSVRRQGRCTQSGDSLRGVRRTARANVAIRLLALLGYLLGYLLLAVALCVFLRSNVSVATSPQEIVLRTRECVSC